MPSLIPSRERPPYVVENRIDISTALAVRWRLDVVIVHREDFARVDEIVVDALCDLFRRRAGRKPVDVAVVFCYPMRSMSPAFAPVRARYMRTGCDPRAVPGPAWAGALGTRTVHAAGGTITIAREMKV